MDGKEIRARALQRFLDENPQVQAKINILPKARAAALQISLQELKDEELQRKYSEHADALGIPEEELNYRLGLNTDEERQQARIERAKQRAENLGMTWDEYLDSNPHLRGLSLT